MSVLRVILAWLERLTRPRAGTLMRASRLDQMPPSGHPEYAAALHVMRKTAEAFLRSGGVLTLEDFCELTADERAAFEVAGATVAAEGAAAMGLAGQGALGAACVLAETDDGDARIRVLLEQAIANAKPGGRG